MTQVEAPKGEKLVAITFDCVQRGLLQFYDSLTPYTDKLITPDRFKPKSYAELAEIEEADNPLKAHKLFQILNQSGIPADDLRAHWQVTADASAYYWNTVAEKPTLYLSDHIYKNFEHEKASERATHAVTTGFTLIRIQLNTLAYSHPTIPLPDLPYREMLREGVYYDLVVPELVKHKKVEDQAVHFDKESEQEAKVREVTEAVNNLFDKEEIRYISGGTGIFMLGERQNAQTAEWAIGRDLASDTLHYLAEPVRRQFYEFLRQALPPLRPYSYDAFSKEFRRDPETLRGIQRMRSIFSTLDFKDIKEVLDCYFHGDLPLHLSTVGVIPDKFSGWSFEPMPSTGEAALESYLKSKFSGVAN